MKMTRIIRILLPVFIVIVLSCLSGCGIITDSLEVRYRDEYIIRNEKLEKSSPIIWESEDETIAAVNEGIITGLAPGSTLVTAKTTEGKLLAKYSVSVITIPVTSIVLSTNECEIVEGESIQLQYTLFPENASDYGLGWKSADETIATVDEEGCIVAGSVGQTTISISNKDGFIATCSVRVKKALPNFKILYGKWEEKDWFSVADDGTWMKFDTNPNNEDSDDTWLFILDYIAVTDNLPKVLEELGFNSSVYEKMGLTNALMGKQEESSEIATASWTYHPDRGLEVFIEVNK